MSRLGDALGRTGEGRKATPAVGPPQAAMTVPDDARSELRRRRDALAEQVMELHWDLGGLAYEMAIRDHFRLDVLVRRAAILQGLDAELAELERLLRLEEGASAGACPDCGAPHSRGAAFCWQCGARLMEYAASSAIPARDGSEEDATLAMEALLASKDGSGPLSSSRASLVEE